MFWQQLVNGLVLGCVYALIAVGYTLVYGVIELINFAHGEIYMLGAFFMYTYLNIGISFYFAFILAVISCIIIGIFLDIIAYRPVRHSDRLSALITAIGMSIFFQNLALIIWGANIKRYSRNVIPAFFKKLAINLPDDSIPIFKNVFLTISYLQITIIVLSIILMIVLHLIINKTKIGTAMRAIAQDKQAAALMGIDVNRVISFTFALGSGLAAVAGILIGMYYNSIYPTMGYIAGIKAFAAAVLGGIGSVPGAMLGGVVLGMAETFGAGYISSQYRHGIAYAAMIFVILFNPSGLLGKKRVEKV
jgi:branched-chain amino acid transport system permease protein